MYFAGGLHLADCMFVIGRIAWIFRSHIIYVTPIIAHHRRSELHLPCSTSGQGLAASGFRMGVDGLLQALLVVLGGPERFLNRFHWTMSWNHQCRRIHLEYTDWTVQYILITDPIHPKPWKTCIIQIQYITITSLLSSIHLIHLTIPHSIHSGLSHYISVHPTMVARYILPNHNTSNTSFLGPTIQPTVHPVDLQCISIHPQYLNWYILVLSSIHHSIHPAKKTIHPIIPIHPSIHLNTSCYFSILSVLTSHFNLPTCSETRGISPK